ncbi:MAG: glycosyltransferase [Patescibacteria group bacterium]
MKILQINKFFYLKGGAERCFFDTVEILEQHGHEVAVFSMVDKKNYPSRWQKYFVGNINYHTPAAWARKLSLALKFIRNREAAKKLQKLIDDFKPEIAHLHNIYHQLSPSIIKVLAKNKIPMVMTLHDYKVICPNYNLFVLGKNYDRCRQGKFYQCLLDRCVGGSFWQSLLGTIEAYYNQRLYRQINLFIAPSKFLEQKFKDYGFKERITNLPYAFIKRESQFTGENIIEENYFLYAGRISAEKGLDVLIKAMRNINNSRLIIAGDGPERERLEKLTAELKLKNKINFIGRQDQTALFNLIKNANAVIVPSVWHENLPYAVIEAMGLTKIVICSKIGGLLEMIEDGKTGFFFNPNDYRDLALVIKKTLNLKPNELKLIGERANKVVEEKYSPDQYYQKLINCYQQVIGL